MAADTRSGTRPRNFGLDLVRAGATMLVFVSHFGGFGSYLLGGAPPSWINIPGFFGVEAFFVLSGYLIGGLLLEIAETDPTPRSWLIFMIRRWMRTLPAYFAVLLAIYYLVPDQHLLRGFLLPYASLTQNLAWPIQGGPWFAVSWSLTIEEWFYLLFSAAFLLCAAIGGCRRLWLATGLFILLPLIGRWWMPADIDWDEGVRKVALLRLDAIAYGVATVMLLRERPTLLRHAKALLAAGLLLCVLAAALLGIDRFAVEGAAARALIFSLTSTGVALCFPALLGLSPGSRWWAATVRNLAQLSYGLYLVHFSILLAFFYAWRDGKIAGALALPLAIAATYVAASLSFHCLEAPILARRPPQRRAAARRPELPRATADG